MCIMTSNLRPDDPGYSNESSSFFINDLRERIMNLENMIRDLTQSISFHRNELEMENERLRILNNTLEDTNRQLNDALNSGHENSLNVQRYRRNDRRNAHTPGHVYGDISPSRLRRQTNQILGSPSDSNHNSNNSNVNRRLNFDNRARNTARRRFRY